MSNITLNTVFVGKLMLDGFNDLQEVGRFMERYFMNAWVAQEAPIEIRKVKNNKRLAEDQFPTSFDRKATAEQFVKRGFCFIERIGPVQVNLNAKVSKLMDNYRLELDSFAFEQNGAKLPPVVKLTLSEM